MVGHCLLAYNVQVFPTGALISPGVNLTSSDVTYYYNIRQC